MPTTPPPSSELALIMRSLEAINETLKGNQPADVEIEPPQSGVGNPEASRIQREGLHPGTSLENCRISNSQSLLGVMQVNVT